MKPITAYCLLLLYTLALCKPVLPLVQDDLAHIFWKAKHLATVHQHYGDHHADEELESAEEEENHQQPVSTKTAEPVSVHVLADNLYCVLKPALSKPSFATSSYTLSLGCFTKFYPPPRFC